MNTDKSEKQKTVLLKILKQNNETKKPTTKTLIFSRVLLFSYKCEGRS